MITLTVDHALPPSTMSASRSPEEWVRFEVKDTGIGVKPEQLDQVFDAFTQGDTFTARQYGGTGLGSAISSRYCHMMGGDIAVESKPGQGATFTVTDPAQPRVLRWVWGSASGRTDGDPAVRSWVGIWPG